MESRIDREVEIRKFVSLAEHFFSSPESRLIPDFEATYPRKINFSDREDLKKIILWYTRECFSYKLLNAVLRGTEDPLALSYVKLIAKDLINAIKFLS